MRSCLQFVRDRLPPIALAGGFLATLSVPAFADYTRHHLGIGVGYYELTSDQLHVHATSSTGEDLGDIDLRTALFGLLRYRYSVTPLIDLTLEGRGTVRKDSVPTIPGESQLKTYWIGPGVRLSFASEGIRPYAQATIYSVTEDLEFGGNPSRSETGPGFGVFAGAEVRATNLLSVPLEVGYTYGRPDHDVSGIGGSVGLAFNFGQLP